MTIPPKQPKTVSIGYVGNNERTTYHLRILEHQIAQIPE